MLTVHCPHCGGRPETEFHNGGPAGLTRTFVAALIDDSAFARHLFERPLGSTNVQAERWCHTWGCGQWFTATRHLANDTVIGGAA